ncbi:MAG: ethylbenzene dehydrogenase-related protein [bacterium]|nr:ethylbenzene dehydrogenase-related protein [bacterium]
MKLNSKTLFLAGAFSLLLAGCEKGYFPKPPAPPAAKVPLETTTLEASYAANVPVSLTDAFWKNADFLRVAVSDLNKGSLYSDGFLNMTGTYGGLATFNKGADPKVVMKAAYTDTKLYVYMEWLDSDINPAFATASLIAAADPLKTDTTGGWTSQGNCDRVALAFDISNASSAAGTFVDKGCAASCHLNKMQPASGSVDIWSWDLANSDALGYASDLVTNSTAGLINDAGQGMSASNKKVSGNSRSEPAYEWDGAEQSYVRAVDGKTVTLDAGYFLLNKIAFVGDFKKGQAIFNNPTLGSGCAHCHGENGVNGEATSFANVSFARKYSRESMTSTALQDGHDGKNYFAQISLADRDHLFAFIRGIGGVPGTYLTVPSGSAADVWTVSNMARTKIDVSKAHTLYQVLMVRNLTNGNTDDVQFTSPSGKAVPFGIALMNGDGKNHIGSLKQILTFKSKTP